MSNSVVPSFQDEEQHEIIEQPIQPPPTLGALSEQLVNDLTPKTGGFEPVDLSNRMHVNVFSSGKLLGYEDPNPEPVQGGQEVPFIPLNLALNYVKKMEEDMKVMHKNHVQILDQIDKCYYNIEQDTHTKYKEFIEKWKSQHEFKYSKLKDALEESQKQKDDMRKWADDNIKALQEKIRELTEEKRKVLEDFSQSLEGGQQSSQAALRAIEHEYVVKMETMKQEYERNIEMNKSAPVPAPIVMPVSNQSNQDQVDKLNYEILDLKKQLALAAIVAPVADSKENDKLEKENFELRQVIAQLNAMSSTDKEENERLSLENKRLAEEIAQLALLIRAPATATEDSISVKERDSLKLQLDEQQALYTSSIASISSERDSLKRELDAIKSSMNQPTDSDEPEIQFLKAQLTFLNTELSNNRSTISELESNCSKLQSELEASDRKHSEVSAALELSNDRIALLEAQLADLISKPPKVVSDENDKKLIAELESQVAKLSVKPKSEGKEKQRIAELEAKLAAVAGLSDGSEKKRIAELEKLVAELRAGGHAASDGSEKKRIAELESLVAELRAGGHVAEEHKVSGKVDKHKAGENVAASASNLEMQAEFEKKLIELRQAHEEIETLKVQLQQATEIPSAMIAAKPNDDKEKANLRKQLKKSQNHIVLLQEEIEKLKEERADATQLELLTTQLQQAHEYIAELEARLKALEAIKHAPSSQDSSEPAAIPVILPELSASGPSNEEMSALREQIEALSLENQKLASEKAAIAASIPVIDESKVKNKSDKDAKIKQRIAELENELTTRPQPKEVESLKAHIKILETQIKESSSSSSEQIKSMRDQITNLENTHNEKVREMEIQAKNANSESQGIIKKLANEQAVLQHEKADLEASLAAAVANQGKMSVEIEQLRRVAGQAEEYSRQVATLGATVKELQEHSLLKEQELKDSLRQRKLLHNQLEDLKGKIRVFCRVRPLSRRELEMDSVNITSIVDEFTINCEAKTGQVKPFMYDSVFGPNSTQDEVFEDTKRLVQSAVDGYNVCIFAYGQTGSGKTFTIQGTPDSPGVTPRAIDELFNILNNLPKHYSWEVKCYMVELYLDNLVDLFCPKEQMGNPPQLNIKKDPKGMVVIPEAHQITVNNPRELMSKFDEGNLNRHTSSTKMNDTSSRSHLVFGVLIDVMNHETQQRTVGKLSLVDLAGSERVSKTEATAERLKEGRAINKSLAALGDVISALSSGESHIPYRNNKLTMLMSDSLGGTAKTLMFVNVSPASYNREESMMSLYYAARVKLITNEPIKNIETKEMSYMKQQIVELSVERDKLKAAFEASGIDANRIEQLAAQAKPVEEFNDPKYDEL